MHAFSIQGAVLLICHLNCHHLWLCDYHEMMQFVVAALPTPAALELKLAHKPSSQLVWCKGPCDRRDTVLGVLAEQCEL